MKTTYQKPTTEVVEIETCNMIAGSDLLQDIVDNGQDLGSAPETDETGGNLSRSLDLWDDEDW